MFKFLNKFGKKKQVIYAEGSFEKLPSAYTKKQSVRSRNRTARSVAVRNGTLDSTRMSWVQDLANRSGKSNAEYFKNCFNVGQQFITYFDALGIERLAKREILTDSDFLKVKS